jgi:hypothetical protein
MKPVEDQIERELRAMRPEIDHGFAAKLDAWAAAGFPARGDSPAPSRPSRFRGLRLSPLLPRLATAASLLLVLTVSVGVLSQVGGDSDDSDDSGVAELSVEQEDGAGAGTAAGTPERLQESGGDASVVAPEPTVPQPPGGEEKLLPGQEREVARDASMRLSTEPDEVDDVADGVIEVTERYDGIVLRSDVQTQAERARATFDLRIPAQNLQATLADLSDLASVSERDEASLDVTAPFVSAEERFDVAKAEVDALVDGLTQADSAGEIAQIRERLRVARGELAAARAELATLKQRTDFSKLAVTVVGDGDSDGWSLGDAIDDAGSVLEDLTGATLVALAALIPFALILGGGWLLHTRMRRSRRDKMLDQ